ncbi:MAG: ATP-binding protein, partial [Candidatus Aenigmatarchaeota archaeon]
MFDEDEYVKRDLEDEIREYIDSPEIIVVVGPRQAGKTTLLKKIHHGLENSKFLTFEDRDVLNLFEEDEKEFAEIHLEGNDYLFVDEFQYAEKGGKKLKYLYDQYPDKKIFITGSSTAEMTVNGLKHLTGRVLKFSLHPFNFREFLRYRDEDLFHLYQKKEKKIGGWIEDKEELDITDTSLKNLEKLRKEYTVYGGYPRVVLSETKEEKKKVLKNIVDTYLVREIRDVLSISEDREIEDLMKILAVQMGEKINYNSISDKAEISYGKLKERLNIFEHTFILRQVRPFYSNKSKEISKSPKIYFYDNGFRNALLDSFQDPDLRKDQGELNENFFFTQTREELNYWRTKSNAEVDFILDKNEPCPFEVKTTPKMTRSARSFCEKYKPERFFILNESRFEKKE